MYIERERERNRERERERESMRHKEKWNRESKDTCYICYDKQTKNMVTCEKDVPFQFQLQKKLRAKQTVFSDIESKKGKAIFSSSISKARLFVFRFFLSPPLSPPPPLLLLNPIPLTRYYVERENVSNSPWTTVQKQTHLNKPWDVLGWIFPFPLLDGGPVGGWGSLADRWTKAGALLLFDSPTEVGPAIISMLELSLDELSVCWSSVRINLMFSPIECSNEDTCRDSWSILAFISSTGRPGPLWKSPRSEKREGGEKKRKKKKEKKD